ncbi:glycosyltransferase family 4 protein [Aeromicrobium sp.]|uniref:glycosyltransferase family 4 protein n=1 Tax=Aeromicrobium sp. TaxID=1871063 RepID=UPI0019AEFEA6|nr:glycosyltransferase family 4 protein [Aeromicrobium sp.]MBC7630238.1 glycosyltransferase [Aeromicrobium sp.]
MMTAPLSGLDGSRLLVLLIDEAVDPPPLRGLGHTEIVIVRRGSDGELDARVRGPFERAIIVGGGAHVDALQRAHAYVIEHLAPGDPVWFVDPAAGTTVTLRAVEAAFPRLVPSVRVMPPPFDMSVVEVSAGASRRGIDKLRRRLLSTSRLTRTLTSTTEVRSRIEQLLLPDQPTGDDGHDIELGAWLDAEQGRRSLFTAELTDAVGSAPSGEAFSRVETILRSIGENARLDVWRAEVKEHRPDLLMPWLADIEALLTVHRPGRLRALLERALECDDARGADLDLLTEGFFNILNPWLFGQLVAYVDLHVGEVVATDTSRFPRLRALVDVLDELPDGWQDRLDELTGSPDDDLWALKVAMSIKVEEAVGLLFPRVDRSRLTEQQISRIAVQAWRGGFNDLGLELARSVTTEGSATQRVQSVLGEHESFDMQASGWTPPPLRAAPAYDVVPTSVVHVLQNSLPYRQTGSANRSQGLLAGLVAEGFSSTAVTRPGFPFADVEKAQQADIEVRHEIQGVVYHHLLNGGVVLPRFPVQRFIASFSAEIEALARAESAALIHAASNAYNALAGIVAARTLGIPAIYEVRALYEEGRRSRNEAFTATPQYQFALHLETLAAQEADRVIAITGGLRDTLVERGVPADKIRVVPNGVDTERFVPRARDEALAAHYGLQDTVVIGYVGSFNWYEGHELLFEAFARLHARHPHTRLLMVGGGEQADILQRLRTEMRLEDAILMPGSVPFEQVEAHYSLIDIAPITRLSTVVTETVSPLKPFEAMAMAKTVVSSDVAVMTEIIDDGRNGLLFAKGDSTSLENVLDRLTVDADLRTRLGAQAREWVVAERDWKILARQMAKVYRELGVG